MGWDGMGWDGMGWDGVFLFPIKSNNHYNILNILI
jgi:hypothetical protein